MPEPFTADTEGGWPVRFTATELADAFASLDLRVDPASPVAPLLDGAAEIVDGRGAPPIGPAVERALRVLAAPRQLLLLRLGAKANGGDVLGFLSAEGFAVRFDVGDIGCTIAEPCGYERFGALIADLAGASGTKAIGEDIVVGRWFLETVVALRDAGLVVLEGRSLGREKVEVALAELVDFVDPDMLLGALERDGMVNVEDSRVTIRSEWSQRYPYMVVPAGLKLEAIEIADLAAGRLRWSGVAVLGEPPERVVSMPAGCDEGRNDALLSLRPATLVTITEAVLRLFEPPPGPPYSPVAEFEIGVHAMLQEERGFDADSSWHTQRAGLPIVTCGEDRPPTSMFAPQAIVELTLWKRAGGRAERVVLAVDGDGAVEWTADGSVVRWRALRYGQVGPRVAGVIPFFGSAPSGGRPRRLTGSEVQHLFVPQIPIEDDRIAGVLDFTPADEEITLCVIRAAHRLDGKDHERHILLASGPAAGTWWLRPDGDRFVAQRAAAEEIEVAVIRALAPAPSTTAPPSGAFEKASG